MARCAADKQVVLVGSGTGRPKWCRSRIPDLVFVVLGELVYPGGGEEILKLVADARAGKRLEF